MFQRLYNLILIAAGLLLPRLTSAARDIPLQVGILAQDRVQDLAQYVGLVYQYLVGIAGIFAVAMIMYAGMKWIFAGGDKGKIDAARETINHAVIGLILALASYLILNTINPSLVRLQVPEIRTLTGVQLAQGWCPNEAEYEGRYQCGREYQLQDTQGYVGKCRGAHCPAGTGGCFKAGTAYRCVDPSVCPISCNAINTLAAVTSDDLLRAYCESDVCKTQITAGCRVQSWTIARGEGQPSGYPAHPATKCIDRIAVGDHFCSEDKDCARGSFCVTARGINTCERTPINNLANWTDCDLNIPRSCGPTSKCIDGIGPDGECSNGTVGAPCDSGADCQGDLRCHDCRAPLEDNKCGPAGVKTCFRYSFGCSEEERNSYQCYD